MTEDTGVSAYYTRWNCKTQWIF